VGIAMLDNHTATSSVIRQGRREESARLAELASILSGCSIRTALDAVRRTPEQDALTRVATAICVHRRRQPLLTSRPQAVVA
jgi:hypothetical protein